jgi:hypothetical protein
MLTYIPNDMSASVVDGVGDEPHEADGAAPVDQVYAPLHLHNRTKQSGTQTSVVHAVTENSSLFVCSSVVAALNFYSSKKRIELI